MAKRQVRYQTLASIKQNASEITGKKVNIVYRNGQVALAQIVSIENDVLTARNMRLKMFKAELNTIEELILDLDA